MGRHCCSGLSSRHKGQACTELHLLLGRSTSECAAVSGKGETKISAFLGPSWWGTVLRLGFRVKPPERLHLELGIG